MAGIRVSKKHSVNPSVCKCWYCGGDQGSLILAGEIKGDKEMPMSGVWDMNPCTECEGHMENGVILIGVKDEDTLQEVERLRQQWKGTYGHKPNHRKPYPGHFIPDPIRSGGWWLVREEFITRNFNDKTAEHVLGCRWAFIIQADAEQFGFPKGESSDGNDQVADTDT